MNKRELKVLSNLTTSIMARFYGAIRVRASGAEYFPDGNRRFLIQRGREPPR